MISGYTLLDYRARYDTKAFLRKRMQRTLIPFLFWSLFGFCYVWWYHGVPPDDSPSRIIEGILTHRYIDIYWFFMPLFAVYLSLPLFGLIPAEKQPRVFAYLIGYAFVSFSLLPFLRNISGIDYDWQIHSPVSAGFLLYALLGYYLGKWPPARRWRLLIYALGMGGLLLHCLGTILLSPPDKVNELFKGYLNFPCVLYAAALFLWARQHDWSWLARGGVARLLTACRNAALGVYVLHIYFIWQMHEYFPQAKQVIGFRIFGALAIFILCVLIASLIRKLPLLRALIP
jgi:integral membrane protein